VVQQAFALSASPLLPLTVMLVPESVFALVPDHGNGPQIVIEIDWVIWLDRETGYVAAVLQRSLSALMVAGDPETLHCVFALYYQQAQGCFDVNFAVALALLQSKELCIVHCSLHGLGCPIQSRNVLMAVLSLSTSATEA
jgi:hypothetical protein